MFHRIKKKLHNRSSSYKAKLKPVWTPKESKASYIDLPKHEDFDCMWEANKGLVFKAAYVIGGEKGADPQSLVGSLIFRFNYCLYHYDPARGTFAGLFWLHLREFVDWIFLRHESERREVSFAIRRRDDKDWEDALKEYAYHEHGRKLYTVPDRDDEWTAEILDEFEDRRDLWRFLSKDLHPRYRDIIELYYEGGFTLAEISEHYGITRQRVQQIHARALESIRERLVKLERWVHLFKEKLPASTEEPQ